jgi:hypothetical protein
MTDKDDTPADSPMARRLMDTRLSGTDEREHMNGDRPKLSRTPPELAPLPVNPSALDVAVRYGSDSSWLRANWPKLVDAVTDLQHAVRMQKVTHWAWPLACGVFAAAAAAAWLPRLLGR